MVNGPPLKPLNVCKKPYRGKIGRKLFRYPEVQNIKAASSEIEMDIAKQPSIITYHNILTGDLDFLVFKLSYPWDHLPGIALISSNGGLFNRWNGEPFKFTDLHEGLVVARNRDIMELVLEQVSKPLSRSPEILKLKPRQS